MFVLHDELDCFIISAISSQFCCTRYSMRTLMTSNIHALVECGCHCVDNLFGCIALTTRT